jgi:phenylalanyl-tRNA synthetase beta chain
MQHKNEPADLYFLKGIAEGVFKLLNIQPDKTEVVPVPKLDDHIVFKKNGQILAGLGEVNKRSLAKFDIKQPVFFAGLNWELLIELAAQQKAAIKELPRFPAVQRDLAIVVPKQLQFEAVEQSVQNIRLDKLQELHLFDIFESEKLGAGKKSMAISFTFLDEEKTLTDKEIDEWMNRIMTALEKDLNAEIRK